LVGFLLDLSGKAELLPKWCSLKVSKLLRLWEISAVCRFWLNPFGALQNTCTYWQGLRRPIGWLNILLTKLTVRCDFPQEEGEQKNDE
jgi:hypothetical protein